MDLKELSLTTFAKELKTIASQVISKPLPSGRLGGGWLLPPFLQKIFVFFLQHLCKNANFASRSTEVYSRV